MSKLLYSVDLTLGNIPDEIYEDLIGEIEEAIMNIIEQSDDLNNQSPITLDIGIGYEQEV